MTVALKDHVTAALALLPQQFKGKAKLTGLLTALVQQTQYVEDAFYDLWLGRMVDTATGDALKRIGKIVGQVFAGEEEELYRRHVRARIAVNRSNGTIPDLIKVARLIIGDDATVEIRAKPYYPAAITIEIFDYPVDDDLAALLLSFLQDAASAGVRLIVESSGVAAAASFSFANGPGLGWGDGAWARGEG